jgi:hypothetical protein
MGILPCLPYPLVRKTDLKIPKGLSEVVNRRRADITMAKMFFYNAPLVSHTRQV